MSPIIIFCLGKLSVKNARSVLYPARANWKNIGIELEVDMGTLNAIEEHCRNNPDKCLPKMLDHWLKQVDPPPSWEALAKALESAPIGEGHLAEQIRQKYCNQSGGKAELSDNQLLNTELTATRLEFFKIYSDYLKTKYIASPFIPDNKWPPTPSTKYINLACIDRREIKRHEADEFTKSTIHGDIDDIYHRKTKISIEHVACKVRKRVGGNVVQESFPKIVLVGGAPGVGKTTFAWELCRRWAQGELLQDYLLVVLVRLRDRYAREAIKLKDLFPFHTKRVSGSLVDEILEINGKSILFILEGFDELPESKRRESIYLHLINGELLPASTVLVTSRPWALSDFHWRYINRVSQWIEILGFTKQQIDEYLISYSTGNCELLDSLRRYVSLNPPIHAAMYIPLNTIIVCEVYRDRHGIGCIIPNTMTELYTAFSLTLLIRYVSDQGYIIRLEKFKHLPPAVHDKFLQVCKIAYEGIKNEQQLVFFNLPDDFETLGFMQSVTELHISGGISLSYNFLHLTIQEFLAAYYLSLHEKYLEQYLKSEPASGGTITRFLAGTRKPYSPSPYEEYLKQSQLLHLQSKPSKLASGGTVTRFLAGITKLQNDVFGEQLPVPSLEPIVIKLNLAKASTANSLPPIPKRWGGISDLGHCLAEEYRRPRTGRLFEEAKVQCHVYLRGNTPHCIWFYESQNLNKVQEYLGHATALISITSDMTPMECFAAGWCIGNSSCVWKLCFSGTNRPFSIDCVEMLQAGLRQSYLPHSHNIIVCELYIGLGVIESDPLTQRAIFDLLT